MDLLHAFPEQEQAAGDQDHVPAGDRFAKDREQRRGQPDDPGQHQQQPDAHEHRHEQSDAARAVAFGRRQFVDQDRDEDHVVDAEHQFQRGERRERDPGLRVGEQFHQGRQNAKGSARIVG